MTSVGMYALEYRPALLNYVVCFLYGGPFTFGYPELYSYVVWAKFKDFGCPCDSRHQLNWKLPRYYLEQPNVLPIICRCERQGEIFFLLVCVCVCGGSGWLVFMARHSDDGTAFSCSFHTADMSDVGSGIFSDKSTSYEVAVWIFQLWVTRNNPELL